MSFETSGETNTEEDKHEYVHQPPFQPSSSTKPRRPDIDNDPDIVVDIAKEMIGDPHRIATRPSSLN
jgi:hypothetical protein